MSANTTNSNLNLSGKISVSAIVYLFVLGGVFYILSNCQTSVLLAIIIVLLVLAMYHVSKGMEHILELLRFFTGNDSGDLDDDTSDLPKNENL